MNDFLNLSSLDAVDTAKYIAEIFESIQPLPSNALLIVEDLRPLPGLLKKRLKSVQWNVLELDPRTGQLPPQIADREFDAVIAVDVIASIPRENRSHLFRGLVRMARRDVLVVAPLGTDLQNLIEDSLARLHRQLLRSEHPWLAAHLHFGLPVPDEVFQWVRHDEDAELFYAGDVIAYRQMAEHVIRSASSGKIALLLAQLTKHNLLESGREELGLETVPMRRHRRLYLHLRRA